MDATTDTLTAGATAETGPLFAEYRRTGDRAIRNTLVEQHRWLGRSCAMRFAGRGEPVDDLEQIAMEGLVKAIDRFDPGFGNTFATYAVPTIVGELRRHFRDRTWAVRVPRRLKDNHLAVKGVVEEIQHALGRSPTIPELAQWTGLSIDDTLEALEVARVYRGVSLDAPGADGPGTGDQDDARHLGVEDPGYARSEARTIVPELLAALPGDRERRIVKLRFVDDLSQSQIATEVGVSQVHVSRLLRNSLRLMRSRLLGA